MPGLNGTGPLGEGSMTGRAMGRCSGNNIDDIAQMGLGRGFGLGRGAGMGRGRRLRCRVLSQPGVVYRFSEHLSPQIERDILSREAELFRVRLKNIENRLQEIENPNDQES
ncbi:MAG: DUF5320 domain-containing protein [Brevinematales bacterium]|nr:DUF5320 domain-containing protein [Brevinematales bacterium]